MADTAEPATEGVQPRKLYVRLGNLQDVEAIQDIFTRSFENDPIINYFRHGVTEGLSEKEWKQNRTFFGFIVKSTLLLKGRLTVVIDPEAKGEDGSEGKVVAAACWLPPGKRLSFGTPVVAVKSGLFGCIKSWGWGGFGRFSLIYPDKTHDGMHRCFKEMGHAKSNIEKTWYLLMTATNPTHQGRGCLSLLVREAFANAPDQIFTLEATTAKSRDQYLHLGYAQPTSIHIGKGKVNETGLADKGEKATGFSIYALAKWPSQ
ncbi:hypothetical protein BJ165DRAFT_681776 [Panaeolus papilionaceus]|nr:hypothetical protein BJ165DRAFT_681776 [Panaeolus papilionaceus]